MPPSSTNKTDFVNHKTHIREIGQVTLFKTTCNSERFRILWRFANIFQLFENQDEERHIEFFFQGRAADTKFNRVCIHLDFTLQMYVSGQKNPMCVNVRHFFSSSFPGSS